MKMILVRECKNGAKEIQVFNRISCGKILRSVWLEGECRAILEDANQINDLQAKRIERLSIGADWILVEPQ